MIDLHSHILPGIDTGLTMHPYRWLSLGMARIAQDVAASAVMPSFQSARLEQRGTRSGRRDHPFVGDVAAARKMDQPTKNLGAKQLRHPRVMKISALRTCRLRYLVYHNAHNSCHADA